MSQTFYGIYYAWEAVFTKEEMADLNENTVRELQDRYIEEAIRRSEASGIQIQSFPGIEMTSLPGRTPYKVFCINRMDIEDVVPSVKPHWRTAEEQVLADGYFHRVKRALNAHFYADEKYRFFISLGAEEAAALGKRFVIYENLS
jgi:hypothetical protein